MLDRLAIAGYRSLRDVVLSLGQLTVVTGANGSGKSSLYRALRLLADTAQGRIITSLAAEGGLQSTLWAGPESISRAMRSGEHPVQGTVRSKSTALKLGFSSDDYGYAIDLGLPTQPLFPHDPEIKTEAVWAGEKLSRRNLLAERRGPLVRVKSEQTDAWVEKFDKLSSFDSMMTHVADMTDGMELLMLRERMRRWRFYDNLRTDRDAPARRPQIATFTPVLASDGADVAAAIGTIAAVGDEGALQDAIGDAFDGATLDLDPTSSLLQMRQHGLLRPLGSAELSDGTLRYILLVAALLSPRPPELMILNEPEVSLHPSLLVPLARLLADASRRCQIILVSHAPGLIDALASEGVCTFVELEKDLGETFVRDADAPDWEWPTR